MLVADVDSNGLHPLYQKSNITNLGQDVDATGMLAQESIDRVCATCEKYLQEIARLSTEETPVHVTCLATSASRDAGNADDFAQRMSDLGLTISIIPGQREAQLSFLGASVDFAGEHLLVADIGGGSTELIAGVGGQGIVYAHSFDIGARRATERIIKSDPAKPEERAALAQWVQTEMKPFFEHLQELQFVPQRFVAVAGTATSVVAIDKALDPYDPAQVHAQSVTEERLTQIANDLSAMTLAQRCEVVGLQPFRAPIMVAGITILQQIVALAGLRAYTASETDILEGIIMDAAMQQDEWPPHMA